MTTTGWRGGTYWHPCKYPFADCNCLFFYASPPPPPPPDKLNLCYTTLWISYDNIKAQTFFLYLPYWHAERAFTDLSLNMQLIVQTRWCVCVVIYKINPLLPFNLCLWVCSGQIMLESLWSFSLNILPLYLESIILMSISM